MNPSGYHEDPISTSSVRRALWQPCFRRGFIVVALYMHLALLALLTIGLPAHVPTSGTALVAALVDHIADVRWMASISAFPFVTVVTYSLALLGALMLAVLSGFALMDLQAYQKMVRSKSVPTRLLYFVFALLLLVMPYLFELSVGEHQKSKPFFDLVSSNRLALMFWVEGTFVFFYTCWLFVFVEFTTFVGSVLGKRS